MERETSYFYLDKTDKLMSTVGGPLGPLTAGGSSAFRKQRTGKSTGHPNARVNRSSSFSNQQGSLPRGSGSRVSTHSNRNSQNEQHSSDGVGIQSVSAKDFFDQMIDYLGSVDSVLRSNICTYHQIVKNAARKQISSGDLFRQGGDGHLLEAELSYFRNLEATTRRQRRQLEWSIRQKLHILHSDWKTFLKIQYPELSKSLA